MQYSLQVHGDDEQVCHVDASSAEDALRQLATRSDGGPVRARFLTSDEASGHQTTRLTDSYGTRRRRGGRDTGHTRTHLDRGGRR